MTQSKALMRGGWVLLAVSIVIGMFAATSFAYDVDAEFLNEYAMVFPVGRLIPPGGMNNADDINFQDIEPIFSLQVTEGAGGPDRMKFLIRLEIAGGGTIFTVSSRAFTVQQMIDLGEKNNRELALVPFIGVGEGDDINAADMLEYIDGGNMVANLYVLTVLLAQDGRTTDEWDQALQEAQNNGYGVSSATMRARNPSQVELTSPDNNGSVESNPVFGWNFPRNPGVQFNLLLVEMENNEQDPNTVLDFANDQNTFLDKTYNADGFGELTVYPYQGIGEERPLRIGYPYAWRVTATAPTMFLGEGIRIESFPRIFTFGPPIPTITDNSVVDNLAEGVYPNFEWEVDEVIQGMTFGIRVEGDDGIVADITNIQTMPGQESYNYQYGMNPINDAELRSGDYTYTISLHIDEYGGQAIDREVQGNFTYRSPAGVLRLVAPRAEAELDNGRPTFTWSYEGEEPESFTLEVRSVMGIGGDWSSIVGNIGGNSRTARLDDEIMMDPMYPYLWTVTAHMEDGRDIEPSPEQRSFYFNPPTIVNDEPPEEVFTRTPTFRWHLSSQLPPGYSINYVLNWNMMNEVYSGSQATFTPDNADVLGMQPGQTNMCQIVGGVTRPDQVSFDIIDAPIGELTFSFTPPDVTLRSPADGATVFVQNPTFEWEFPENIDANVTGFTLDVDGNSFDAGANARQLTIDAQNWGEGSQHNWSVTANIENVNPVVSDTRSFTYMGVQMDQLSLTLSSPDNDATVEDDSPLFEWEFSELPDGYNVEFELTITPTAGGEGAIHSIAGDQRSWEYVGDPLRPIEYEWNVTASVTGLQEGSVSGTSRTFTYYHEEEIGEGPQQGPMADLLQAMQNNLPQNMVAIAVQAFQAQGWHLGQLRINGVVQDVDSAVELLGRDDINFVSVQVLGQ